MLSHELLSPARAAPFWQPVVNTVVQCLHPKLIFSISLRPGKVHFVVIVWNRSAHRRVVFRLRFHLRWERVAIMEKAQAECVGIFVVQVAVPAPRMTVGRINRRRAMRCEQRAWIIPLDSVDLKVLLKASHV